MSIQVECEQCGAKRKVNERLAGRTIRCPGCEQPLTIPALAPVAEAVAVDHEPVEPEAVEVDAMYIPDAEPAQPVDTAQPVASGQAVATAQAVSTAQAVTTAQARTAPQPTAAEKPERPAPDDEDDDLVPPRKKREDGELDMTPMVDVTFLLLIFFMVTASFSLQKSIQMPRQSSDLPSMSNVEEETEELDPIELEIDESGAFLVLAPEWERETPGKQNLITALKEAIGDNRDGMKLDIKVHENAKLQMLVDGMDAGTIAGFTQLQVTEVDGFD